MNKESSTGIEKKWNIQVVDRNEMSRLSEKLNLDPILAKLLIVRNLHLQSETELERFLNPQKSEIFAFDQISAPDQIEKAYLRIKKSMAKKESIMINGDPDADGITGTTVLVAGFNFLGIKVEYDFPVRAREGHGLQPRIIEFAKQNNCNLIITIDCGTKDIEAVRYAKSLNMDVIICDHHIVGHQIPEALAFINPNLIPRKVPEQELCGSLIAYKFILGLAHFLKIQLPEEFTDYLLSVACLGALSDRVSLLEPMNRIMIRDGINAFNNTNMQGLKALKISCVGADAVLTPNEASRTIVPRLNAPGRIGDPEEDIPDSNIVVDLLLLGTGKRSAKKANRLLKLLKENFIERKRKVGDFETEEDDPLVVKKQMISIENINEKRKKITSQIEDEIESQLPFVLEKNNRIIIIHGQNWNSGVIGIDADRIRDRFLKPVIILTSQKNSDYLRASVRSIPSINMYDLLNSISEKYELEFNKKLFCVEVDTNVGKELVNSFGGHPQACGFSIHKENVELLISSIYQTVDQMPIENFQFSYDILEAIPFSEIKPSFVKKFDCLSPFGQKFELPIFLLTSCSIGKIRPFGSRYQASQTPHVEFAISPSYGSDNNPTRQIKAIGFGLYKKMKEIATLPEFQKFDIIFTLETYKEGKRKNGKGKRDHIIVNVLDMRRTKS